MDIIVLESLEADGISMPEGLNYSTLSSELTVPQNLYDLANKNEVKQYTGYGYDRLTSVDNHVLAFSNYEDGEWAVIFKYNRNLDGEEGVSFIEESFIPLSFYVWDGFNNEHGIASSITAWYSLYLKASVKKSPIVPMLT